MAFNNKPVWDFSSCFTNNQSNECDLTNKKKKYKFEFTNNQDSQLNLTNDKMHFEYTNNNNNNLKDLHSHHNEEILNNIFYKYHDIAIEFAKIYYSKYRGDYNDLTELFSSNTKITHLGDEMISANELKNKILINKIDKIDYCNIDITSQPIDENKILINVIGQMLINYDTNIKKFTETIILTKLNDNRFYITNMIFKYI